MDKSPEKYEIDYSDQRTKIGNWFYNVTDKCADFLMRHMWLYYILNYTWGIIMTVIGWIVIGFVKLFLNKHITETDKFGPCLYHMLFDNWGGIELGVNFLIADRMGADWTLHTKCHECGHTFQNAIWGPLCIFISFLPSAIRYWVRRISKKSDTPYDLAWFEQSATFIGGKYYRMFIDKESD